MNEESTEQDSVATLMRTAGRRAFPDPARFDRALKNVTAEWQDVLAQRRRVQHRRWAASFVIFALAAVLAGVFWPKAAQTIATANRVAGEVLVRAVNEGRMQVAPLQAEQPVVSGSELETGSNGRVLLHWNSGAQLRVDQRSLIELASDHEVRLMRGTVYVETHSHPSGSGKATQLVVTTPFGVARHLGTRFEVSVTTTSARVRVKEGAVRFDHERRAPVTIQAGQQLSIVSGAFALEPAPSTADAAWDPWPDLALQWILDGRSAFDAIEMLTQDSGLRVVYVDEIARAQARSVILRGNIEGMEPRKALLAVLAGSGLAFDVRDDRIEIRAGHEP